MGVDKAPILWYNTRMKNNEQIEQQVAQTIASIQSWSFIEEERSQGHTGSGSATEKPLEVQVEELMHLVQESLDTLYKVQETL